MLVVVVVVVVVMLLLLVVLPVVLLVVLLVVLARHLPAALGTPCLTPAQHPRLGPTARERHPREMKHPAAVARSGLD